MMLEDPSPSGKPDFTNRIADAEFSIFMRSLATLPSRMPFEVVNSGAEAFLCHGRHARFVEERSSAQEQALLTLQGTIRETFLEASDQSESQSPLSLLFSRDYVVRAKSDTEIAVAYRIRNSSGVEYLQTNDGFYALPGHATLLVASASLEDPESFCIDNHFSPIALGDMFEPFVECLREPTDNSWRHSYIASALLECFEDTVDPSSSEWKIPAPGILSQDRKKLVLSLDTEHGPIVAQITHNHRFQQLNVTLAREVRDSQAKEK